jgi:Skp family chaperone for outer membrane proteins
MAFRAFCDRCELPGGITSRGFAGSIAVTVTQPQPYHLCESCLAELILGALTSMSETPPAIAYVDMKKKASDTTQAYAAVESLTMERNRLERELAEAKSLQTTAARYDGWLKERAELLEQIAALERERDVALTKSAQAERNAADTVRRARAAHVQAEVDGRDAGYVERIQKREALRRS